MSDNAHVIDCARRLVAAYRAFVKMQESGDDGGAALKEELRTLGPRSMAEAGSVWVDFLCGKGEQNGKL